MKVIYVNLVFTFRSLMALLFSYLMLETCEKIFYVTLRIRLRNEALICVRADIIVLLSFSLLFVVLLLLLLLLLFALWWLYRSYWKSQIISRGSLSLGCLWKTGRETEQKENRSVWKIRSRKLRRHEEDNDVKSRCIQVRKKPLGSTRIHEWKIWTASFKVKHVGCKRCLQTEFSICRRVKSISLRCFINFHKSQCWS